MRARICMLMAATITSLVVPTAASAQKYYMRAKISGLGPSAAATPPIEYRGIWRNTGELSPGFCENGSRRVDWVYECRVDGNISYSGDGCDPGPHDWNWIDDHPRPACTNSRIGGGS